MNIKKLFQKNPPKKMNATTRRATMPIAEDYDVDEPNVKLSKAFFVVMLLHVVAVGGIFAFSSLKKNTPPPMDAPLVESPEKGSDLSPDGRIYVVTANDSLGSIASTFGLTRNDLEAANHFTESSSIKTGDKLLIPTKSTAKPVPLNVQKLLQLSQNTKTAPAPVKVNSTAPAVPKTTSAMDATTPAGGKIYVVQKGDNPVLIAKHQGVKYADLLSVNKITDPKKLQIGQKLIIPSK